MEQINTIAEELMTSIGAWKQESFQPLELPQYDEPVVANKYRKKREVDLKQCGIYERYEDVTFESIRNKGLPTQVKEQAVKAWEYAKNIEKNIDAGDGLTFMGGVGTMKTTLAIAIMRKALEVGYTVYFVPMVSLLDILYTTKGEERQKFEKKIRNIDLLVLDDLGAETTQEWILAKVDSIITERYNRRKSTIVTTNLNTKRLEDAYNARIIDRLRSVNTNLVFKGTSLR